MRGQLGLNEHGGQPYSSPDLPRILAELKAMAAPAPNETLVE